jgi:GrpB-like predicted nucleotidyltransferase (UPF0157 family)
MVRKIIVVPHDPIWPIRFRQEADWLSSILGKEIVAIHHFGSTSIPDIYAKPIIDILVEIRDIDQIDAANERMVQQGYTPMGEFGIPGRRFFFKGSDDHRSHHIHFYLAGHPEVKRHLDFRDYILAHPEDAEAYSQLKIALAQRFPEDIAGYNAGKDQFVKGIDRKAKVWSMNGRKQLVSRSDLADRIEIASQALLAAVARIPPSQLLQPGVLGDWSVKDILAHINFWQGLLLRQIQATLLEKPVPQHADDVDALNAQAVSHSQQLPWGDVAQEFMHLAQEMISVVIELPEEDLCKPGRYWAIDQEPLWRSIASETCEHYAEHLDQIRAWRQRKAA